MPCMPALALALTCCVYRLVYYMSYALHVVSSPWRCESKIYKTNVSSSSVIVCIKS